MLNQIIEEKKIKIKIIGSTDNLPSKIIEIIREAEKITNENKILNLNLAFNYGFKDEIKNVLKKYKKNIDSFNIDDNREIKKLFYLDEIDDPQILIRTGGYKRLSNFIMYNLTYTELFFTDTLWPEFNEIEFQKIIKEYHKINRKYGL